MKRIVLEVVSASEMRPPYNEQDEGGDWFIGPKGDLVIRVIGDRIDRPQAFLFALHEMTEAVLCAREGVAQATVDAFDRARGPWKEGDPEPGDHPDSPYRTQHRRAMLVEHLMAYFLGLSDYGKIA